MRFAPCCAVLCCAVLCCAVPCLGGALLWSSRARAGWANPHVPATDTRSPPRRQMERELLQKHIEWDQHMATDIRDLQDA